MRDMVEIGMGRTARRTYELDDINICLLYTSDAADE